MENNEIKRKTNKVRDFLKNNIKMKGLTTYIIFNVIYILVASYLATIKQITYETMSKGYVILLVFNVVIGIVIAIKGYYKKNIVHLCMFLIIIFRNNFNNICGESANSIMGNGK